MRAVGYVHAGPISDPQILVDFQAEDPTPRARDVVVRVHAISVNPVDTKVRTRKEPPAGTPAILGWDAAGVVIATGAHCELFEIGDEVYYAGAIDRPGSNAQLQAVDERLVAHKPATIGFVAAAALPLTTITAWELLFDRFAVARAASSSPGALLIVGGAGGVGSMMIQLARALTNLTVIATASRESSAAWCRKLGAHHIIDHNQPWANQLRAIGLPLVDLVASLTGTQQHLPSILEVIRPQGKVGIIDDPATLDCKPFKNKCVSLHWEYMFARSLFATPDMIKQHELLRACATLVDAGTLRTTLAEHYGTICASNVRKAHLTLEGGRSIGKIVLEGF